MTLHALLERDYALMLNDAQVRLVSGVWGDARYGEVNPAMLETAKKNLAGFFAVVGLTEQFDKTVLLLKETFQWQGAITYLRRNVSEEGKTAARLPRATLDLIERSISRIRPCTLRRKLFKKQCARQGPGFTFASVIFNT